EMKVSGACILIQINTHVGPPNQFSDDQAKQRSNCIMERRSLGHGV
ncbi:10980_t:CDS:2, partial [Dentiscutata heterogama]